MSATELAFDELVHAKPANVLLPLRKRVSSSMFGFHVSTSKARGMEFDEVRAYVPGDDVRNIDWHITARTGTPHTKLFREERDRTIYILTDLTDTMYFGSEGLMKAKVAAVMSASLAWQGIANRDKISGLIAVKNEVIRTSPASQRQDVYRYLQNVHDAYHKGLANPTSNKTVGDMLKTLSETIRPGSVVFVLSDFYQLSAKNLTLLHYLNRNHIVTCYHVFDKMEIEISRDGTLYVDNINSVGYISSSDQKFLEDYKKIGMHRMRLLSAQLRHSCQRYVALDASKQ